MKRATTKSGDSDFVLDSSLAFSTNGGVIRGTTYAFVRAEKVELDVPVVDSLTLPLAIFTNANPCATLICYLHDACGLTFAQIGRAIKRDQRAVQRMYALYRHQTTFTVAPLTETIPLTAFSDGGNVLWCLVRYLLSQGRRQSDIAQLLQRDPRTIWTVRSRGERT